MASALQLTEGTRLFSRFSEIEEKIGIFEIILSKYIIDENVKEEMTKSMVDELGRYLINATMDGGWNHRGSGRAYDSDSCQHVVYGAESKKIIALHTMSRACAKCSNNNTHHPFLCSKNFHGSSKAMEAHGAAVNVNTLFERYNCIVDTIIMDDDSSTKNVLKRKYSDLQEEAKKEGKKFEWPKYEGGGKRPDTGLLPINHADPKFKADINHRLRGKSRKEHSLATGPKYKSECTKADASKLKRNFSQAVFQNRTKPLPKIKKTCLAVLEHLFGNHTYCDISWCKFLQAEGDEEKNSKLYQWEKEKDDKLYNQLKTIEELYTSKEALRESKVHHIETGLALSRLLFIAKIAKWFKRWSLNIKVAR